MKRTDLVAQATARRELALRLRALGTTWADIGKQLGVTAGRACQIAHPCGVHRAGNPRAALPDPPRTAAQVDEYAAAVARMVAAK